VVKLSALGASDHSKSLIGAQFAIAAYQRAGGPTAAPANTVEEIIGRPARTFRYFAREHARLPGGS
jgi:hypothetical protein